MKRNETSARIKEIMSSLLYYLSYWYSRTNWECNMHACLLIDLRLDLHATIHCYVFAGQLLCSQLQEYKNIWSKPYLSDKWNREHRKRRGAICVHFHESKYLFHKYGTAWISSRSIEKLISTLSFNRLCAIFMNNEIWSNIRDYETQMRQLRRWPIRGK